MFLTDVIGAAIDWLQGDTKHAVYYDDLKNMDNPLLNDVLAKKMSKETGVCMHVCVLTSSQPFLTLPTSLLSC